MAVAFLLVSGIYQLRYLPIDAVPDITDNQVQVITVTPALGAPDVERVISFPIEQACAGIPGIKQVRSFSRFGLSLVTIVFTDETDIYWARQQVNEKLQSLIRDLPAGIGVPELAPVTTGLGEIFQYVVKPIKGYENKYSVMDLRTIQDWIVRRNLLGTPGVAEVASFGGKLKQYEIAVRTDQLKTYGLSVSDLFTALQKNNENTGGAYIERGPSVLYIRSEGLTQSLDEIGQILVKVLPDGVPILIRDVAEVHIGSAIRYGAMTYNGEREVAGAVVMMLKGGNSSDVVAKVKIRISEIQKMMPEGVVIEPFLDRTKMVNNAISTVKSNLLEGALIVIFVLVFFLGNIRAGLIVSSVIPLSMLFAVILMNYFKVDGNLMSLGAIDFGLIVDGSVIVVEAILHRFAHSKHFRSLPNVTQDAMDEEVGHSTSLMIRSAVFSQIIILIVYLPILSLQGIEGKMFKPMAFTVGFAILGAFLLSITYVPMMAALGLNKKLKHSKSLADKLTYWLEQKYHPLIMSALKFPKTIIASTLVLFSISVVILMSLGGEFMPQIEEGDFAVETRLLTGSNLSNTIQVTNQAASILLKKFPEVRKVVTKIGSAEIPTDPMPFEAGDMMVILKDKHEWTSAKTFPELSQKMTTALSEIPGISVGFQFPVQMRFNELMTGARQDVVCKIFGENLDSLTKYAEQLSAVIGTVKGAINIYQEKVKGMPQVIIKYNRSAIAKYGLNVNDVNKTVNIAFAGQVAGQVYEQEKKFDLVVRLAGDARRNVADIESLLIPTANGGQIPLSMIASVEEKDDVNQIQRENTQRRIIVGFNISGRDVQSTVEELQQKVNKQLHIPKEYRIKYGGSFENMTAAKDRLAIVVPIALLLIFLLLYFAFNSVKQGLIIYSAIPLSATGGILALWIRDLPFSISAGVGFIALFGVAVLNGILLISECNRLRHEGWTDDVRIVVHAAKSKLRAILMTALVPSLGFIPMAISTGAGGEVQKPLATVVIGGLIISTFLTLFLLPIIYVMSSHKKKIAIKTAASIVILMLFTMPNCIAQTSGISLQSALDSARKANFHIRSAAVDVAIRKAEVATSYNIDKTEVLYEKGNFNSIESDSKWTVSQAIQFPGVYTSQHQYNRSSVTQSELQLKNRQVEVETSIKQLFYHGVILQAKKQLLKQADSLYQNSERVAEIRFRTGEIDGIELAAIQNQRAQAANQLILVEGGEHSDLLLLRATMNTEGLFTPECDSIIYPFNDPIPNTNPENTAGLSLKAGQITLAKTQLAIEKNKFMPGFVFGYNNSSIAGWQTLTNNTLKYYDGHYRFSSAYAGVSLPLFFGAQNARIKAAKQEVTKTELDFLMAQKTRETELEVAVAELEKLTQIITKYKQQILPNARLVFEQASRKLSLGEINFINWMILANQSIQSQSDYLDYVKYRNEKVFEIEKLCSKIN